MRGEKILSHPPQLPSYGITRDVRLRFVSNAAFDAAITFQNLLDLILVAVSATSGFDLFEGVRINSVEVWAISAVGTPATAVVVFSGVTIGAYGDQKTHTDTSVGIEPAHVKAKPDPRTQAGQFQLSSADVAFSLDIPTGSVIDVSLSLRQPVAAEAVACQNVLVGATAGAVYYRGLDGKALSLTALPCVGALSTI
jgi:hypothetical protein